MTDILCNTPGCALPVARIVDGKLVVVSRHHGEHHVNQLPLSWFRPTRKQVEERLTAAGIPVTIG